MTDARLRGRTRWSAAAKCPLWASLALRGEEASEPSARQRGWWARGKAMGSFVAGRYADKYGEEGVIREKPVPWPTKGLPLGELHTDIFVIDDALAVEVKSSDHPESLLDAAFTQLAGEVHFDPDAEAGALHIISPSNWADEEILPFVLTKQWRDRVEDLAAQVAEAGRGGPLPACSQDTPGGCRAIGCPYTNVAWAEWAPPADGQLEGEALEIARSMYEVDRQRRASRTLFDLYDEEWKQLCASLADLVPAGRYEAGPLRLTGTAFKGRETFSLAKARKSGVWNEAHDEMLGPFVSVGDGHVRWKVERAGDEPLIPVEEFGGVAPF